MELIYPIVYLGIFASILFLMSSLSAAGFWAWWLLSECSSLRARRGADRATSATIYCGALFLAVAVIAVSWDIIQSVLLRH